MRFLHHTFVLVICLAAAGCVEEPRLPDDGGVDAGCAPEIAILCDGDALTARDSCTGASTVVETCVGACYRGACVDCAPGAGRLCQGAEVYELDSCGALGARVETCTGACAAGQCADAGCTPDASTTCVGDTVYSQDSCGNIENAVQVCEAGCTAGACSGCTPMSFLQCWMGDIYALDSCLAIGDMVEDCDDYCEFDPATSIVSCATGGACTPRAGRTCFMGDIHWVDSCGGVQTEIQEDCPSGCNNMGCLPCVPIPVGNTCVGNNVHELLGGCPGADATTGAMLEACANGCREGACLPPGCVPDVGTVCSSGDAYLVDSCGAIGSLLEACAADCIRGACSVPDGGTPPDAGGPPDAGASCACVLSDSYPGFECTMEGLGSISRCTGCLGVDAPCDDTAGGVRGTSCVELCSPSFTCDGGNVLLGEEIILGCSGCSAEPPIDCNAILCGAVCSTGAGDRP